MSYFLFCKLIKAEIRFKLIQINQIFIVLFLFLFCCLLNPLLCFIDDYLKLLLLMTTMISLFVFVCLFFNTFCMSSIQNHLKYMIQSITFRVGFIDTHNCLSLELGPLKMDISNVLLDIIPVEIYT